MYIANNLEKLKELIEKMATNERSIININFKLTRDYTIPAYFKGAMRV